MKPTGHELRIATALLAVALLFWGLGRYLDGLESDRLDRLTVVVTAKVPRDDSFQFFYSNGDEVAFRVAQSARAEVRGSADWQQITFELDSVGVLNGLRLDIGSNPAQGPIDVGQIAFFKENETIRIGADRFREVFRPNRFVEVTEQGSFQGISGTSGNRKIHDPYLTVGGSDELIAALRYQKYVRYPYLIAGFVCLILLLIMRSNPMMFRWNKESVFAGVFMLILIAPVLQMNFNWFPVLESAEKRTLAKKPELVFDEEYPAHYETYFNDHFGFRNYLVRWGADMKTKVLRSSTHPELVQFGRNDWLYYNRLDGKIFKSYTRTNLLPDSVLRAVGDKWETNRANYEALGATYLRGFWPNKHSIYDEYLPRVMKAQIQDTIPRVDQIIRYLEQSGSKVTLTDVRGELRRLKDSVQLYHKFDTHWNNFGAFVAYREFFRRNAGALGMPPKSIADFEISWEPFGKGELIDMLGVRNNGYFEELNPEFRLRNLPDQVTYLGTEGYPRQTVRTRNEACGNKLKVLVFRDSFFTKLIPFFSSHFYEVTYIWGHGEKYVEQLRPDFVIEAYVERSTGEQIR